MHAEEHPLAAAANAPRHLRYLCSRKTLDFNEVIEYIDSLPSAQLNEVVRGCNENGKTPLHYAAQLRPGADGAALCAALLERRADVDAVTRRGHTALLFAAGRGHAKTVEVLLDANANPRIVSASGEVPWRCSSGANLGADTLARLIAAQEADNRPWQDFRQSSEARAAQSEYERWSLQSVAHQVANVRISDATDDICSDGKTSGNRAELVKCIVHAVECEPPSAVTFALVTAVAKDNVAARTALRMIFAGESSVRAVCPTLRACREDALRQEAERLGGKRLRKVIVARIVCALLHELKTSGAPKKLTSQEIIVAAGSDVPLALEVLLVRGPVWIDEGHAVYGAWTAAVRLVQQHDKSLSELAWTIVGKLQVQGRQRQFATCRDYVLLLRWAVGICHAPGYLDLVSEVCELASCTGCGLQLSEIQQDLELPMDVGSHVLAVLSERPNLRSGSQNRVSAQTLPRYVLEATLEWVADTVAVAKMRDVMDAMLEHVQSPEDTLFIGVDTEWGKDESDDLPPSLVQVAVHGKTWVIDVRDDSPEFGRLFSRLASDTRVRLLGFSFSRDASRLVSLMRREGELAWSSEELMAIVTDLQRLAMSREPFSKDPGALRGLHRVTEAILGRSLDKSLQCSDWDARPLSDTQLRYAATDAAVLLDIASAMGLGEHAQHIPESLTV